MNVRVTSRVKVIEAAVKGQMAAMLNGAAEALVQTAQALAPYATGFLHDNISQVEDATAQDLTARVESAAEYSAAVELGHHAKRTARLKAKGGTAPEIGPVEGTYVPPRPFFNPGIEAAKRKMKDIEVRL